MLSVDYITRAAVPQANPDCTELERTRVLFVLMTLLLRWLSVFPLLLTLSVSFTCRPWRVFHCFAASIAEVREAKAGTKRKAWRVVGVSLASERFIGNSWLREAFFLGRGGGVHRLLFRFGLAGSGVLQTCSG